MAQEMRVMFEEITVSFSQEEWEYLDEGQKELYQEVMKENHETLIFLETNLQFVNPDMLSKIRRDSRMSRKRKATRSYADDEAKQENRKEQPLKRKLCPKQVIVSQWTVGGESGRRRQESPTEQRRPAGDSPDGATERERSDRQLRNTPVHQRLLKSKTTFQNNDSERKTSKCPQGEKTGKKSFVCKSCGKNFDKKPCFISHQETHREEKTFLCSECGKAFTLRRYLLKHERVHKGERPFACAQCGKTFPRKDTLIVHQKFHTGERPFHCSECGQCYILKKHLQAHLKIHTGERPFACSECGRCFPVRRELRRHLRTHTGERPFPCTECHKAFSRKEGLEKHLRVHTGEKPFPCSECGKRFSRKDLLKYHQTRQHQPPMSSQETSFEAD
uniref:Zinc finger protein 350-like isoform X2 n=1 Tax=Geotrypetes seraphini TaxID=260995 RepID=A0A6P8Q5G7_GEOSA|nr:zinc finger protein 350-like isoform X2 [Geotrypetes seraphini]